MGSDKIFCFLNPYKNDLLSSLSEKDLNELLLLLDDYYLSMRDRIYINGKVTFGMEFEFELLLKGKLLDKVSGNSTIPKDLKFAILREIKADIDEYLKYRGYILKEELNIDFGGEITSPILTDTVSNWYDVETIINILKSYFATAERVSSHIHVGSNVFGDDIRAWCNFIKLWSCYEDVINRFLYGEFVSERRQLSEYARPHANYMIKTYKLLTSLYNDVDSDDFVYSMTENLDRNVAVNLLNVKIPVSNRNLEGSTIEFRCPNGTLNSIIWQNNVNFITKLLLYAKSERFNDKVVDKQLSDISWMDDLNFYREIHIRKALELADLIFDNNFDKVYFLRQYTKSFEVGHECGVKAKQFTL